MGIHDNYPAGYNSSGEELLEWVDVYEHLNTPEFWKEMNDEEFTTISDIVMAKRRERILKGLTN
jgi:hypothetical protein